MSRKKNKSFTPTGGPCPHSSSCFTCTMSDCVMDARFQYNEILPRGFIRELLHEDDPEDWG